MTTRPTASTVLAPLATRFEVNGAGFSLVAEGEQLFAQAEHGRQRQRVVLATGSHHYQAYWTEGPRPGELKLLPFVYLAYDRRLVPRRSVFLTPDSAPPTEVGWGSSCIQCHSVAGRPGLSESSTRFDTSVAELGIACEACHGPAAAHVDKHRNPLERAIARVNARGDRMLDDTIVNPAKLDAARSTAVCAQCHSLSFPRDPASFWEHGTATARPDRPWDTRQLLTMESLRDETGRSPTVNASVDDLFWRDGTIRIGGREANAHYLSPCFTGTSKSTPGSARTSCLSCHSMHESEPDDQLARGKEGDGACTGCHRSFDREAHTHHARTSAGSRCASCHMPRTTFALLGAIRTHRIEVPNVAKAMQGGRLPACNLCHLDRSLAWTDQRLSAWSGWVAPRTTDDADDESAAVRWLLSGNAAQRALAATHLGLDETRTATGSAWQAPLLAELLVDPYAAVRYVAARSLHALPGFENVAFDFVGPRADHEQARRDVHRRYEQLGGGERVAPERRDALLLTREGHSDSAAIAGHTSQRDDRAITIAE